MRKLPCVAIDESAAASAAISQVRIEEAQDRQVLDGVNDYTVSFDGEKMLYRKASSGHRRTGEPPTPAPRPSGIRPAQARAMEVYVDPRAEWKQIYTRSGASSATSSTTRTFTASISQSCQGATSPTSTASPAALTRTTSSTKCSGTSRSATCSSAAAIARQPKNVKGGLLGADYTIENGRYRFAQIYNGENWNPQLQAPLTQPGVNVKVGEYLLAVNGRDLHATDNIYSFFEETAGKQVVLKVGPNPDGNGSREVTVVPVENEDELRHLALDRGQPPQGRSVTRRHASAYVYLPDTAGGGYTNFNRYFFAQVGKRPSSSTSATTKAASSPTTSSTTCAVRS